MKLTRLSLLVATMTAYSLSADTWTDGNGAVWTYKVSGGKAGIECYDGPASASGAVTVPSGIGGYPVVSVNGGAFCDCSELTSVVIPNGVTSVWQSAFENCSSLARIKMPGTVCLIGGCAFDGSGLRELTIPASVTRIGYQAFRATKNLRHVYFEGPPPREEYVSTVLKAVPGAVATPGGISMPDPPSGSAEWEPIFYDTSPNAIGYYSPEHAEEWRAAIDSDGTWQGLKMVLNANGYMEGDDAGLDGDDDDIDISGAVYDALRAWLKSLGGRYDPTAVVVGDDFVELAYADFPYVMPSSGAVLNKTKDGYRLDLKGVHAGPIQADGDLAIYLEKENFIDLHGQSGNAAGITLSTVALSSERLFPRTGDLLIFGPGGLTILGENEMHAGIKAASISILAGSSVSVYGCMTGIASTEGDVRLRGCMVGVYSYGTSVTSAIECNGGNLNVLASMLSISSVGGLSPHRGFYASGGKAVFNGSVVNMFTSGECIFCSDLEVTRSYFVAARTSANANGAICCGYANFDKSVAKMYSFSPASVQSSLCLYIPTLKFGKGDYSIVHKSKCYSDNKDAARYACAIKTVEMLVDGGDVKVCAPGGVGIEVSRLGMGMHSTDLYTSTRAIVVASGKLEFVKNIGMKKFLKYDAGIAAGYTAAVGGGLFDVSTAAVDFYTHVYLDALSNGLVEDAKGYAAIAINADLYVQSGGTVLTPGARHGITTYGAVVNGGSCSGPFYKYDIGGTVRNPKYIYTDNPPHSFIGEKMTDPLVRVEYAVPGASAGDKVKRSWNGLLPKYYGTKSLYADEKGRLYFWLPTGRHSLKLAATNGGSVSGGGKYKTGKSVSLRAVAKSGYAFAGWFTDKKCTKALNPPGYDNRMPTVKVRMSSVTTKYYAKFITKAQAKKSLKFKSSTKSLAKTAAKAKFGKTFSLSLGFSSATLPSVTAKNLPKGLVINKKTGRIHGKPTKKGSFSATVTVRDAAGNKITQKVRIKVS